jgi:parallel beta-helix repeat protein
MPTKLRPHGAPMLVSFAVILALAVAGVMVLSGGRALASHVSCGDTITTDTTLDSDLVNCPNNGIVIGADDVTLDLNGHLVDGDGTPAAVCDPDTEFCDTGVASDGHDGITVMHGSVREFDFGVWVGNFTGRIVRHNRLLGISSSRNRFAGLGFFHVARSVIRNSSGNGNGVVGWFLVQDSHHVRILHNSFRHNGDQGIFVADSARNLIRRNLLSRNKVYGIVLERADRNQVRRNRSVRDGEVGIYVAPGSRNVIVRNRVSHIHRAEGMGRAIEVDGGDRNVIARNSVRDTEADAIIVGCPRCPVVVGSVVRRNRIRGAGRDGVHIDHKAKHTLLRRNRVRHSKDDGIDVEGRTTKLTENRAVRNADLGIEAVRGVIDGGGNIARYNGDPRQCTNIVCT